MQKDYVDDSSATDCDELDEFVKEVTIETGPPSAVGNKQELGGKEIYGPDHR